MILPHRMQAHSKVRWHLGFVLQVRRTKKPNLRPPARCRANMYRNGAWRRSFLKWKRIGLVLEAGSRAVTGSTVTLDARNDIWCWNIEIILETYSNYYYDIFCIFLRNVQNIEKLSWESPYLDVSYGNLFIFELSLRLTIRREPLCLVWKIHGCKLYTVMGEGAQSASQTRKGNKRKGGIRRSATDGWAVAGNMWFDWCRISCPELHHWVNLRFWGVKKWGSGGWVKSNSWNGTCECQWANDVVAARKRITCHCNLIFAPKTRLCFFVCASLCHRADIFELSLRLTIRWEPLSLVWKIHDCKLYVVMGGGA